MAFPDKPIAHLMGSNGPVHAVAYSASPGTYILTGSSDRSVRLYNPASGNNIVSGGGPGGFGSTNNNITNKSSSGKNASILPEGRLIQSYAAHGYEVLSLTVSQDNARFASAGGDRSVFLWDVATAQTLRRFGGGQQSHSARINAVTFAGDDDSVLVSASLDTTARLWDCRSQSNRPIQILSEARDSITCVAVRDAEVLTGSVDGRLRCYDVRMGKCVTDVIGPSITSLALTRDGKAVLVGALDSNLRLMDRDNGSCLRRFAHPDWTNQDLRVQSLMGGKEQYVLAGDEMAGGPGRQPGTSSSEGRIWVWDVLSGDVKTTISVPWGPPGYEPKKVVGRDGKEKERTNVASCFAWRDGGFGDQWCTGGTSGVVTVFGYH